MANPGERVRYTLTTTSGRTGSGFCVEHGQDAEPFKWIMSKPGADDPVNSAVFELVPDDSDEGPHEIDGDDWRALTERGELSTVAKWARRGAGLNSAVDAAIAEFNPDEFEAMERVARKPAPAADTAPLHYEPADALQAIRARMSGTWDDPQLVRLGALMTAPELDVQRILDATA